MRSTESLLINCNSSAIHDSNSTFKTLCFISFSSVQLIVKTYLLSRSSRGSTVQVIDSHPLSPAVPTPDWLSPLLVTGSKPLSPIVGGGKFPYTSPLPWPFSSLSFSLLLPFPLSSPFPPRVPSRLLWLRDVGRTQPPPAGQVESSRQMHFDEFWFQTVAFGEASAAIFWWNVID